MGLPVGTAERTLVSILPNSNYPTVSNYPALFDLSRCTTAWWSAVSVAGDIVVYDAVADVIRPRHICGAFSKAGNTGWISVDTPVSAAGRQLYLCVVPSSGAVDAAAAHTNSGCFSAYGLDEASGNFIDKTGAYSGVASGVASYGVSGLVCKKATMNSGSTINLGRVTQLSSVNKFGVTWLLDISSFAATNYLFYRNVSGTNTMRVYIDTSKVLNIFLRNANTYTYTSNLSSLVSVNTPFLLSMYYDYTKSTDAERFKVYLNGSLLTGSGSTALPSSLGDLSTVDTFIQSNAFGATIAGSLDEVRLWNLMNSSSFEFLQYKNMLDHSNFASYAYVTETPTGTQLWRNFKPRFRLGV
jgi:hypothetical protein